MGGTFQSKPSTVIAEKDDLSKVIPEKDDLTLQLGQVVKFEMLIEEFFARLYGDKLDFKRRIPVKGQKGLEVRLSLKSKGCVVALTANREAEVLVKNLALLDTRGQGISWSGILPLATLGPGFRQKREFQFRGTKEFKFFKDRRSLYPANAVKLVFEFAVVEPKLGDHRKLKTQFLREEGKADRVTGA